MIFNTLEYFLLFLIPAAVLFRTTRPDVRPWILVAFGALFFVYYSLTSVGGIPGAVCLSIFVWETLFSRLYRKGSVWCLLGIAQSILFLAVFKYWNFLTGLFLGDADANPLHWNGQFLPLGISFFTFEFIHYAVDRYKDRTPPGKFSEYFAFILFFPTMVAGPIKRYQDFLPKLQAPSTRWTQDWERGITRILTGLAKKYVIADLLTAMTDNFTVGHGDDPAAKMANIAAAEYWVLPLWIVAYGMKIYFDFSAYSDIAIGSTRLFGIKVPENFDWPYARHNLAEFWRHWHISLSKWLTDYVFIPLGGSRVATPRIYANLLITMLVSGIWHGAGTNFAIWGLWHGAGLAVHRVWSQWRGTRDVAPTGAAYGIGVAITFIYANCGWTFFCMDTTTALFFLKRLLTG